MSYELIFEVRPLTESIEDDIYSEVDALISAHGTQTYITVTADGSSAVDAGRRIVEKLEQVGVHVIRCCEDLVSRKVIASRLDVSPQAVGLWVRGERSTEDAFPNPYSFAAGGVWLWSDVEQWATRRGFLEQDFQPVSATDYTMLNYWLLHERNLDHQSDSKVLPWGHVGSGTMLVLHGPAMLSESLSWAAGERTAFSLAR